MDAKTGDRCTAPHGEKVRRCGLARSHQSRLVAEPALARDPSPRRRADPTATISTMPRRSWSSTTGAEARPHRLDDGQPALVAGRLWALRPILHSHGLARCGHLSHRRRPRRRQLRPAAFRSAQQLAGQRQPRQGEALLWPIKQKYGRTSAGRTCSSWPAMSRLNPWAARSSASAAAAKDVYQPEHDITGDRGELGRTGRQTPHGRDAGTRWKIRLRQSRWASST